MLHYQHACCGRVGGDLRDGGGDDAEDEEDQGRRKDREVGKNRANLRKIVDKLRKPVNKRTGNDRQWC